MHAGFLLGLFFGPENTSDKFLQNVGWLSANYTVLYPKRHNSKTKFRGFSPQANYTDRATVACRRSKCQLLRIEGVARSAQRIPTAVNLGFLDRSRYFSIQVGPQLYSWGWVDPVPDPLLLRKSGSAGNRNQDLWICSQEHWPQDHRCGQKTQLY
jgi:hypothetical protein